MANDLNQCNFIGRLGSDPETRYTASGDAVCSFRIAVGWKSKDKEGAEWVSVSAFGKLAEICSEYLRKGAQVFVSGRMKTDEYEKDGIKRYSTKIAAERMQMLGGKQDKDRTEPGDGYVPAPEKRETSGVARSMVIKQTDVKSGDLDDDIPF
jgi:single-strand DNA-binding protein